MKTLLIPFVLLFLVSGIHAQNNFEINFGSVNGDVGNTIHQTLDGKYILAGTSYITGWVDAEVYLALIDTDGTVLWTKSYGGGLDDAPAALRQTSDSGFVIAGRTSSFGAGMSDVYLLRTDAGGDTLWTRTYGGSDFDLGKDVQLTYDGGFIVAGQESSTNGGIANMYLIKTDASGDTLWTRSYPAGAWTGAMGVVQTPDSGYMVFGDFENNVTGTGDYDLICLKLNSQGDSLWSTTYPDSVYHDYAQAIRQTADGGFVLASQRENQYIPSEPGSSRIIRIDAGGDTLWTRVFGVNYTYNIGGIYQTSDSGFAIVGYTFDTVLFSNILFITKINSAGDSLWTVDYTGLFSASGYSIDGTADGGFIVSGYTSDSTFSPGDIYVLKTGANGALFSCQPFIILQPQDSTIHENTDAAFYVAGSQALSYQWQSGIAGVFTNISDGGVFSGTNTATLRVTTAPLSMDGLSFRCILTDSSNCSDTSFIAVLHVTSTTGLDQAERAGQRLYPNPSSTTVTITGEVPRAITLSDALGRILTRQEGRRYFDISRFPAGVYFVTFFYENEKAIVNRLVKD
jgi:hypothetical protein